jgi:hypothetical protein
VNGEFVSDGLAHDPRTGFAFPPATEEQLRQTEEMMGFPHPPLLRALYLHVANGGFGPEEGLIGVPGGCRHLVWRDLRYDHMIKEDLFTHFGEMFCLRSYPDVFDPIWFDLEEREKASDAPRLICLTEREWPTHFLNLCAGAEEESFFVHAKSGRVYLAGNAWHGEKTRTGESATTLLHRQAGSLEEWFEQWLNGERENVYYDGSGNILSNEITLVENDFDPWLIGEMDLQDESEDI